MKAVVFREIGDIGIEDVPVPHIQEPTDAIVRLTASAICGTDLHLVRGTFPGMQSGTILGHEGVGIVEELGKEVRNLREGDRVVISPTIACGYCVYCRAGYYSQCDHANPNGPQAGTTFFGGPAQSGSINGLQAERARIPFANTGLIKLPPEVTDDQAIMLSDIFPSGYFAADLSDIEPGHTVAVFGCGPVGQFAILSALMMGAGRVLAVDTVPSRLEMARTQGAETIDFNVEDPVETIRRLTGGIGTDRAIDAVGVDASHPRKGPAAHRAVELAEQFLQELQQVAPERRSQAESWERGDAPSQALQWCVESVSKGGTLAIVGDYPPSLHSFPLGMATNKNLTVHSGTCNHRKYIPMPVEMVRAGSCDPRQVLSQIQPITAAVDAYKAFDHHQLGWMRVDTGRFELPVAERETRVSAERAPEQTEQVRMPG